MGKSVKKNVIDKSKNKKEVVVKAADLTDEEINKKVEQLQSQSSKFIGKEIPFDKIMNLVNKGVSNSDIARVFNCTPSAISHRLKRNGIVVEKLRDFKAGRAEIMAELQRRLVHSVKDEEIQKTSVRDRLVSAGILFDKERLQRDLSTQNISSHSRIVEEAHKNAIYD